MAQPRHHDRGDGDRQRRGQRHHRPLPDHRRRPPARHRCPRPAVRAGPDRRRTLRSVLGLAGQPDVPPDLAGGQHRGRWPAGPAVRLLAGLHPADHPADPAGRLCRRHRPDRQRRHRRHLPGQEPRPRHRLLLRRHLPARLVPRAAARPAVRYPGRLALGLVGRRRHPDHRRDPDLVPVQGAEDRWRGPRAGRRLVRPRPAAVALAGVPSAVEDPELQPDAAVPAAVRAPADRRLRRAVPGHRARLHQRGRRRRAAAVRDRLLPRHRRRRADGLRAGPAGAASGAGSPTCRPPR